jgi:hypothetical protein
MAAEELAGPAGEPPAAGAGPTLFDTLTALRMGLAQLRLYPRQSPQVAKVASSVHQSLQAFLGGAGAFILASGPEGLLVNGKPFHARDAASTTLEKSFLATLQEAHVRSIRIPRETEPDELISFLHALAHKFWDLKTGKEINERLRREGIQRIALDDVEYVEVTQKDLLIKGGSERLKAQGVQVEDFLKSMEAKIESDAGEEGGSELRMQILGKLLEQEPSLLARLRGGDSSACLLNDAQGILPFEQARAALRTIAQAIPGCPPEAREGLRAAAHAVLEGFRHHRGLFDRMREILTKEAEGVVPDWLEAQAGPPGEPGPVRRARTILSMSAGLQAEALRREGEGLLSELLALGRTDLTDQILARLTSALDDASPAKRRMASESLLSMGKLLESQPFSKALEGIEEKIRTVIEDEKDPRAYTKLSELASFLADSRLQKGEVNQALRLLDILKRHSVLKDSAFPERARLVMPALERVTSGEGYKAVAEAMKPVDGTAERLQQAIDTAAVHFLVSEMKSIESLAERLRVGETITKIGAIAATVLAEEIKQSSVPSEAMRLLEVLPHLVQAGFAEENLESLMRSHPVLSVRRRAAEILAERGYPRAEEILTTAFTTAKDPAFRAGLAEAVCRLRNDTARDLLLTAAGDRSEPDAVRSGCFQALARAQEEIVLPILSEVALNQSRGLGRLFRSVTPALRVAAVRALGLFVVDEGIRDVLAAAAQDSDPAVRDAARQIQSRRGKPPPEVHVEAQPQQAGPDLGSLAGTLQEMPFEPVCRTLASASKTGVLRINSEGSEGKISFAQGQVGKVEFKGMEGQAAFNALASLRSGAYFFKAGPAVPGLGPYFSVQHLLEEAERQAEKNRRGSVASAAPAPASATGPAAARG